MEYLFIPDITGHYQIRAMFVTQTDGQKQPRRNEMLAWWPNMELQVILLQIFIMINEGVHPEFYKFVEIF